MHINKLTTRRETSLELSPIDPTQKSKIGTLSINDNDQIAFQTRLEESDGTLIRNNLNPIEGLFAVNPLEAIKFRNDGTGSMISATELAVHTIYLSRIPFEVIPGQVIDESGKYACGLGGSLSHGDGVFEWDDTAEVGRLLFAVRELDDALPLYNIFNVEIPGPDCGLLGDLDGDNAVGSADLGILLAAWGQSCDGCPEDLDGDGVIGSGDNGLLLSNWGATCEIACNP